MKHIHNWQFAKIIEGGGQFTDKYYHPIFMFVCECGHYKEIEGIFYAKKKEIN